MRYNHCIILISALIFVIDSNDRERVNEAKEELWGLLNAPELQDAILLILANKQVGDTSWLILIKFRLIRPF